MKNWRGLGGKSRCEKELQGMMYDKQARSQVSTRKGVGTGGKPATPVDRKEEKHQGKEVPILDL